MLRIRPIAPRRPSSTRATAASGVVCSKETMGKNRVFFSVTALDEWITEGKVDLSAEELTIKGEHRRYRILEAVRIVAEVTGAPDVHELVGKVKTRSFLRELGAELLETSMVLGDNAYEVVPGFVGAPLGTFEEHLAEAESRRSDPPLSGMSPPLNDEDLLAKYLIETRTTHG